MEETTNKVDQTCLYTVFLYAYTQYLTVQCNEYSFNDNPVTYFVFSSVLPNAASLILSGFLALSLEYLQCWELTIQETTVKFLVSLLCETFKQPSPLRNIFLMGVFDFFF